MSDLQKAEAPNPLAIYQAAITAGADPDKLSKLLDIHERADKMRAEREYAVAMNRCQADMPIVIKDAMNEFTKKSYARLEAVQTAIKPVYLAHGFSLAFSEGKAIKESDIRIVCKVSHTGGHSESHWLDGPLDQSGAQGKSNKSDMQAKGSSVSYLRRYLTLAIFNITVADEDKDGNRVAAVITPDQIGVLNDLIEQVSEARPAKPVNFKGFLAWLGIENLADCPQPEFRRAKFELERQLKECKK